MTSTTTTTSDDPDNIAMYKAMLYNEDINESISSSNDFLGSPTQSKKKSFATSPKHKWGKPKSPEQYRPDDWLGGGSPMSGSAGSGKRASPHSYKVKSISNLPTLDLDTTRNDNGLDKTKDPSSPFYGMKQKTSSRPKKFQSESGKGESTAKAENFSLLPPAFAASMSSPKRTMKKKSASVFVKPSSSTNFDSNENSNVPAAFRSSLNKGINKGGVAGKYGLMSPVSSKKKFVGASSPPPPPGSSLTPTSGRYSKTMAGDVASPYAGIKKRLKSVPSKKQPVLLTEEDEEKEEVNDSNQQIKDSGSSVAIRRRGRGTGVTPGPRSLSERDLSNGVDVTTSPLAAAKQRVSVSLLSAPDSPSSSVLSAPAGSSSFSSAAPGSASPRPARRGRKPNKKQPYKSPKRGSEANSPKPIRVSLQTGILGSGGSFSGDSSRSPSVLDLPFDDNDDNDVDKTEGIAEETTFQGKVYKKRSRKPQRKTISLFDRAAPEMFPASKAKKPAQRSKSVRSLSPTRNRGSSGGNAPRKNYSISPHARKKEALLLSSSIHSEESGASNELANLKSIIAQLKKVQLPDISKVNKKHGTGDRSNEQAHEMMEIIRNLRKVERKDGKKIPTADNTISNTLLDLKKAGYLRSSIQKDELETSKDCCIRLKKIHSRLDDREYCSGQMEIVLRKLEKATATSSNNITDILEDAIAKLKKIIKNLYSNDKTETEDIISDLSKVLSKIGDREEGELAGIIRDYRAGRGSTSNGDEDDPEEMAKVIANLKSLCKVPAENRNPNHSDNDLLADAINRLKKVNLTENEAKECGKMIYNLRCIGGCSEDSTDDDADTLLIEGLSGLQKSFTDTVDAANDSILTAEMKLDEIGSVLKGLRKSKLSDRSWDQLTDLVSSLRPSIGGNVLPNEIQDVISALKKAKLNPKQAKEVGRIVVKLRKTNYPLRLTKEEERELMANLRKFLPMDKNDELFDLVWNVGQVDLDKNDIGALVEAIEKAGENNSDDSGPIGIPELPLSVPVEESVPADGLPLDSNWDRGASYRGGRTPMRRNVENNTEGSSDDDDVSISSVEDDDDTSAYEEESVPAKSVVIPDNGVDLGWDRRKWKRRDGDDNSSGYEEASQSSADGRHAADGASRRKVGMPDGGVDLEWDREKGKSRDDDDNSSGCEEASQSSGDDRQRGGGATRSPKSDKKFHYSCPIVDEPDSLQSPTRKQKKIVFNQKPKWKHKKHNTTVVGEKRWRFQETFGADEVVFSPLSRDQYDRRKKISESLFANLDGGNSLPLDVGDSKKGDEDDDEVYASEVVSDKVGEFMDRKKDTGRRSKYIVTEEAAER